MNEQRIEFSGEILALQASGSLFWPRMEMLIVSDLHLGKSERIARRGGSLLPPYETTETLTRLSDDIARLNPAHVLCLGDSFDDTRAALDLEDAHRATISSLQAGRRWLWVEGNHDPGPVDLGGEYHAEYRTDGLVFRHIAATDARPGEISGHFHPKATIRATSRPCFLCDATRLILPAFGCYTGGLRWTTPALRGLFDAHATAYLTGRKIIAVPVPKAA